MDVEGINLTLKDLLTPPPVMPWREFADWIRMSEDHPTVWGWIRNGYIPSHKVGKHVMVTPAATPATTASATQPPKA